ncbi:hypothetical protein H5410_042122 [Solanum commersonii]|uniref:Uncharacterized protein n=1 Tax=Solanum commersonii TaxID=4109 RepID=A0A9J5XWL7_SOLCO|nr:hypothetical protein H5410_042122 [Solanum commersonii]
MPPISNQHYTKTQPKTPFNSITSNNNIPTIPHPVPASSSSEEHDQTPEEILAEIELQTWKSRPTTL